MFSRITFLVFTVFWLTMTYLLWRSEYAMQNQSGSAVPVSLVWRKILNAPDSSTMRILHAGQKVGYCQWSSSVGRDLTTSKMFTEDASPPEGRAPGPKSLRLNLEGNFIFGEAADRLQFHGELRLTTNNVWQELDLRFGVKPASWEIHSLASEQSVRLNTDDENGTSTRVFTFAELQNPQSILQTFQVPVPLGLPGMMNPLSRPPKSAPAPALGLEWKARNDWVPIGHTSVRAFRLETAVLQQFHIRILVSQVGEILRVDLPDGWELVNDQLLNL